MAVRTAAMTPHHLPAMRRPVKPTTTTVPKYAKSESARTHSMLPDDHQPEVDEHVIRQQDQIHVL